MTTTRFMLRDLRFRAKLALTVARLRSQRAAGRDPVVTYATYRTSSSAIHWAIRRAVGGRAIKAHALLPERLTMSAAVGGIPIGPFGVPANRHVGDWAVMQEVVQPRRPAHFVVVLRDPVAVAVSSFSVGYEWLRPEFMRRDWSAPGACDAATLDELTRAFYDGRFNWRLMPAWMEGDFAPALGLDPYAVEFPRERGHVTVEHGPWRILLLRTDVPNATKGTALSEFLGIPGIEIRRENSTDERGRGGLAAAMRDAVRARPQELAELLDSRFTRHYWLPQEIQAMRTRWLGTA